MRCGIYVRVSADDQRDNGYSIDSQLRMIKEYCEKNEYDIVDVYNDAGHSGKDLMRPEMQRLLKDIKSKKIDKLVEKTKNNTGLVLNIAFNYGGRAELVHSTKVIAEKVKSGEIDIEDINEKLISDSIYTAGQPDPDLMIRTSHELRTSNFLPWQLTYSEFYFPDKHWPEFDREDLIEAIKIYQKRNRRFGGRPDEVKK